MKTEGSTFNTKNEVNGKDLLTRDIQYNKCIKADGIPRSFPPPTRTVNVKTL